MFFANSVPSFSAQTLVNPTSKDSPQARLHALRESRDAANQRRQSINSQLTSQNQQINVKRDATSQLRTKLQYQTEAQIDEMVRRLETQLQQHSYRLSEERRLVAEIDKLRRSKKAVKQYNESKDELQGLRDTHQHLRQERDNITKELMALRAQEDSAHADVRKNKETVDVLKKELDELYDLKRTRISEFKAEQALYQQSRDQRRSELNKQRAQERQAQAQARAQDRDELRNSIEPYQDERNLCATLLSFLGKLEQATPFSTPLTPATPCTSAVNTPMTPDDRRGDEDEGLDGLFLGIPRKASRKVKRSNSKASKKKLVPLTPEILSQFASLQITTPTSLIEVPAAMEALKAKQKLLTCMATAEMKQRASNSNDRVCQEPESSSSPADNSFSETTVHKPSADSLSLDLQVPYLMSNVLQEQPHSLPCILSSTSPSSMVLLSTSNSLGNKSSDPLSLPTVLSTSDSDPLCNGLIES